MQIQLSHSFSRIFRPDKLNAPRGFKRPNIQSSALYLEIGAGKGKHALQFSAQNSDAHLVAIERTKEKYKAFQKAVDDCSLANLTHIHADAIPWTVYGLSPKSLSGVFILYPNPERNNPNQRWLNMPFFEFLLSRIRDEAQIVLVSNIKSYIDEASEQAREVWNLTVNMSQVSAEMQRTHFEIKYLARGERCWQLDIKKPSAYITRFDEFDTNEFNMD